MKTNTLGNTGIEVTELCLGALPMGPLQKDLPLEECTRVVETAIKRGITFIDTAQMYKTYAPIREAIKRTGIRPVIASKSTASDYEGMREAIEEALEQLDVDCVDIFLLHAARADTEVFDVRAGAIECMKEYKSKGRIRAMGISTHNAQVVALTAARRDMDIVFPLINKTGMGILDGTVQDMKKAILESHAAGKGIYLMKVLAGGNLVDNYTASIEFARSLKGYHSIAIGMVSPEEVDFNVAYFDGNYDPKKIPTVKGYSKRYQVFSAICKGCRACVAVCPNFAMEFDEEKKKAYIKKEKCLTCGYCSPVCKEFAIRLV
ncbi:MAG: 4Fe-4S dicluster domain-containing protein [Clostridiales bacterium]|jgi:predicted aldo/keto reductase-like oxidoreductase|nr:4Fe-4S dicluster domain-containing protein [Clostridiales bacterium]